MQVPSTLSDETRSKMTKLRDRYPHVKSAVLPCLYLLQAEKGYCTDAGINDIAEILSMVPADVFSTASFYTMIYKEPVGKKVIDVCTNLACMVNGADQIVEYLSATLKTPIESVSPDGRCCVRRAECLGYCDRAPVMQIDYRPFGPLTTSEIDRIILEEHLTADSGPEENGVETSSVDLSGTRINDLDSGR